MRLDTVRDEMRAQRAAGMTYNAIARLHNCSTGAVRQRVRDVEPAHVGPSPASRAAAAAAQDAEMWGMYVSGMTHQAIADRMHIGRPQVSVRLRDFVADLPEAPRDVILRREQTLFEDIRRRQLAIGYDPEQEPNVRLRALRDALAGAERLAKMLGLDAPVGVNVSGSLSYEIVGVDPSAHQ